jgi:hypothetical protein
MVLTTKNYHQRGVTIVAQGVLPFKYETEKNTTGMTALAGLPVYPDLARVIGLSKSVDTEFRDGNVPAGFEQLRVFKEALNCLPEEVKQVRLRSDTAGYQRGLGKKENNINSIADLKANLLKIDADIVKFKERQANVEVVINDLNKQIEEQEKKVKEMKKD